MELTKQYLKDELEFVHALLISEFRHDLQDAVNIIERLTKELQ